MRTAIGIFVATIGLLLLAAEIWASRTQPRRFVANEVLDWLLRVLVDQPFSGFVVSMGLVVAGACIVWFGGGD